MKQNSFLNLEFLLMSLASCLITDILSVLKDQRAYCNEEYSSIFAVTSDVLSQLDVPIDLPQITMKRQMHRSNIPCSTPKEYYKRSIYIAMLDSVICDLETSFLPKPCHLVNLLACCQ